jgi:hypothetical protein
LRILHAEGNVGTDDKPRFEHLHDELHLPAVSS